MDKKILNNKKVDQETQTTFLGYISAFDHYGAMEQTQKIKSKKDLANQKSDRETLDTSIHNSLKSLTILDKKI